MEFGNATAQELDALCALWQETFGDPPEFSLPIFENAATLSGVFVARQDGELVSMLTALPVSLQGRPGAYYYGLATRKELRGQGLMAQLMAHARHKLQLRGWGFATLVPAGPELFSYYEQQGFVRAFAQRHLVRPIRHNLWAQAEFDAVTAKGLLELRQKYMPNSVELELSGEVVMMTDLYKQGITIISDTDGYGLYFKQGDTLRFVELMAEGDRAAEKLIEAAREKAGGETAQIVLGAEQPLFLGEGEPCDYGMIQFFEEPFDVSESYMQLMLDTENRG